MIASVPCTGFTNILLFLRGGVADETASRELIFTVAVIWSANDYDAFDHEVG